MSYDRYEQRPRSRDPRGQRDPRDSSEPRRHRLDDGYDDDRYRRASAEHDERDERGFLDRAGDEIASWFGDEEAERRRDIDQRDQPRGRSAERRPAREGRPEPFAGERGRSRYGSDPEPSRFDPHYDEWRRRQIDALDRDYEEYRRENQARFDSEFSAWRTTRQSKRQLLGSVREQMEVVGGDDEHLGRVDHIAGDRLILAKDDPGAGGTQHSLSCTSIDRVEGNKVILDTIAEQARKRWRDDNRERALFEREDQGSAGPGILNRSFSGTYR